LNHFSSCGVIGLALPFFFPKGLSIYRSPNQKFFFFPSPRPTKNKTPLLRSTPLSPPNHFYEG
jgi:hypothetical protein